ncbi:MAG: UDP-glucose 4-epimerase GalE, partial [Saprospiraceae bacterium]|nr:UDP-glucose 4-epimerase GalE [Saprospiraceae bacterium]
MDKILVTGGAGYIGSHTIVDLHNQGYELISIDNYTNSDSTTYSQIHEITGIEVTHYDIDICDKVALEEVFKKHGKIRGVIHFAALKAVGESVEKPLKYYHNNINGLINILSVCKDFNVDSLIFSSSCTVYGIPDSSPVDENTPLQPAASPYGATKQMGEQIIKDCINKMNTKCIMLRYFNPAGAHPSGFMGESPINKAANLVPAITETAIGKREQLTVYGGDYNTRDGSCVRDYIHIMDLARAHTMAMSHVLSGKQETQLDIFNLGIGSGATVLEVIEAFERVNNFKLNYTMGPRRPGDIPAIYSNYNKISHTIG